MRLLRRRWSEFTWKDGGVNFLPETGLFAASGDVDAHGDSGALVITGNGWTLVEFAVGPTDIAWDWWRQQHSLPQDLFTK